MGEDEYPNRPWDYARDGDEYERGRRDAELAQEAEENEDRRTRNGAEIGWVRRFDAEGNITHAGPILALKVKRLRPDAKLPTRATSGSGGWDLYACEQAQIGGNAAVNIGTGLAMEIPRGHVGLIRSRSGLSFNRSLVAFDATIDSDYRGGVCVRLYNRGATHEDIQAGDRIAQLVVVPVPEVEIVEAEELSETERGEAGFGSSGR
jgi:dUTP pyrophosphatase